eukprot:9392928-Alexandrium_andersonii.AAC.1
MQVASLITQAREHSWHIALLSNIHRANTPATILALEKYCLILADHAAILLPPELTREWCVSGAKVFRAPGGRSLA